MGMMLLPLLRVTSLVQRTQDDDRDLTFRAPLLVLVWGYISTRRARCRRFSSPLASSALTRTMQRPISTVASGLACRFNHQTGYVRAPPWEATTTKFSSSARYRSGLVRCLLVLRPVVM